jgi:predicted HTH domain antitoxin
MIDVDESIDILRRKGQFSSREEFLSEAVQSFLRDNPELRVELAVEQFASGSVSLNRGAEIAGVSPEEFKTLLADRDIDRDIGFLDSSKSGRTDLVEQL